MFFGVEDLKTDEIFLKLTKTCEEQPEKRWLPAYYLDICLVDGTTIGKCDLRIGHNDKTYIGGNIGYGIDEEYQGHGYATEAVKAAVKWAFSKPEVNAVEAETDPDNIASQKVLEKCGFQPNGEMGEEGPRFVVSR